MVDIESSCDDRFLTLSCCYQGATIFECGRVSEVCVALESCVRATLRAMQNGGAYGARNQSFYLGVSCFGAWLYTAIGF